MENCHCPHGVIICGHLIKNYNVRALSLVLQYYYWHCIVYQECKHILFRTLESVVGQCAFYGVPKSRFEAFNNRLWISYPLEVRKRLRTAENGLKSNSVTDHHRVHKRCSMIWQHHIKRILACPRICCLDGGSIPPRSTITRYEKTQRSQHRWNKQSWKVVVILYLVLIRAWMD